MKVEKYCGSVFFTNTYVISNDNEAVVVDPGLSFKENAEKIKQKYQVKAVLITHGHLDHIDGARYFNCPIYVGSSDLAFFKDSNLSLYTWMNMETPYKNLTLNLIPVKDKERLNLIGLDFKVIYTPGHTNGSVCYLVNDSLFTGDSLFIYGVPRTDFPTGDSQKLRQSTKKLWNLPDTTKVYPGHDEEGTILDSKQKFGNF